MKEYLQVKQFDCLSGGNDSSVNDFLKEIGSRALSVTPVYNNVMGVIAYIVVYWG